MYNCPMHAMLGLQITIFSLIAVGFLLRRIHLIDAHGQKQITDLVLYLVLPCNIVSSFMQQDTGDGVWGEILGIFIISVILQFFSVAYGKFVFRKEPEDRRVNLIYATLCSNAGFLGNPIAEGVFGAPGQMLASVYMTPMRIMMWSRGLALYSGTVDKKATVKKVLTHPCVIACFIGIVLLITGAQLPPFIETPIQTVGRCNTALSMLVIGMILSEIEPKSLVDRTVILYTIHRLVILPLIVYLVLLLVPVTPLVRGVSVLLAAMPAGATTSMLASKYDRDPHFATRLVIFSTLCSIPALLIWSAVLL